jgi:hypothetical protein
MRSMKSNSSFIDCLLTLTDQIKLTRLGGVDGPS